MDPYEKDERAERERRIEAAIQAQLDLDVAEVAKTDSGRRLLWRIIFDAAGAHDRTFRADPIAAAHHDGKRAVGLWLLEQVQSASPADYVHMLSEGVSEQRAIEARAETLNGGADPEPAE